MTHWIKRLCIDCVQRSSVFTILPDYSDNGYISSEAYSAMLWLPSNCKPCHNCQQQTESSLYVEGYKHDVPCIARSVATSCHGDQISLHEVLFLYITKPKFASKVPGWVVVNLALHSDSSVTKSTQNMKANMWKTEMFWKVRFAYYVSIVFYETDENSGTNYAQRNKKITSWIIASND